MASARGIRPIAGLLLAGGLVVGCHPLKPNGEPEPSTSKTPPCWYYQPVTAEYRGAYGIAGPPVDGQRSSRIRTAKQRAYRALANSVGLERAELEERDERIEADTETVPLRSREVRFIDAWWDRGRYHEDFYQYAVLDAPAGLRAGDLRRGCARTCQPKVCEPAWLCQAMGSEHAGFLGVSWEAMSRTDQQQAAIDNAIEQLQFLYGVRAQSDERYVSSSTGLRLRIRSSRVEGRVGPGGEVSVLVTDACEQSRRLFVRVVAYSDAIPPLELPAAGQVTSGQPPPWYRRLEQSARGESASSTGHADLVSTGRLSDQLQLAVKRAMIGLARIQGAKVRDETVVVSSRGSGRFILQDTRVQTDEIVSGRVAGIYIEPMETGDRLRAHVWVLEDSI